MRLLTYNTQGKLELIGGSMCAREAGSYQEVDMGVDRECPLPSPQRLGVLPQLWDWLDSRRFCAPVREVWSMNRRFREEFLRNFCYIIVALEPHDMARTPKVGSKCRIKMCSAG